MKTVCAFVLAVLASQSVFATERCSEEYARRARGLSFGTMPAGLGGAGAAMGTYAGATAAGAAIGGAALLYPAVAAMGVGFAGTLGRAARVRNLAYVIALAEGVELTAAETVAAQEVLENLTSKVSRRVEGDVSSDDVLRVLRETSASGELCDGRIMGYPAMKRFIAARI